MDKISLAISVSYWMVIIDRSALQSTLHSSRKRSETAIVFHARRCWSLLMAFPWSFPAWSGGISRQVWTWLYHPEAVFQWLPKSEGCVKKNKYKPLMQWLHIGRGRRPPILHDDGSPQDGAWRRTPSIAFGWHLWQYFQKWRHIQGTLTGWVCVRSGFLPFPPLTGRGFMKQNAVNC